MVKTFDLALCLGHSGLHRYMAKYLHYRHPKFLRGNDRMKLLALCILVLSMVPLSSAVADLSGQSGRDALSSIESGSSLWNWGSSPLGHVINDSQLLSGVRKDPGDISIMETPLQAQGLDSGGETAPIISGYDNIQLLDKTAFKSAPGVIDCTCFKEPTVAQFPRVY
ncbi:MAG: hypothetical protein BWY13_00167 [Euryarchaeota archaeon ADurb.Bin190]|nr:MAG: hypothetical protein BWY13_00167 [Euryarchaeota archaeon ADurb.Bin190]